jgi:RNA polymerase sigma factor (sigma-70 family)
VLKEKGMSAEPEHLRRLRRALTKLDPRTREVFLLHRSEGLSYGEIAQRLGISAVAVERHIAHALFDLARRMERYERPWWRFW